MDECWNCIFGDGSYLFQVIKTRDSLPDNKPPILVKIAADLTQEAKEDIAEVITTPPVSSWAPYLCLYAKHTDLYQDILYI